MVLLIGIIGATLILFAFVLSELHIWSEDSISYDLVNLIGASFLIWYSWNIQSWPFAILNGVWALVALRDVVMDFRRKNS